MAETVGNDEEIHFGSRVRPCPTPRTQELLPRNKNVGKLLCQRLGLADFASPTVWRASVTELVATAVLVFVLDSVAISTNLNEPHKSPNLQISVLVAFTITVLLIAISPISGGHMNPAVTFSASLVGLISFAHAVIYIIMQCTGAVFGSFALKWIIDDRIENQFSLGGCTLTIIATSTQGPISIGINTNSALWLEIICTFIFLFASIWNAFDSKQAKSLGSVKICAIIGTVVGLIVFLSSSVTQKKGYGGVGMNPARCIGPALVRGGHLWNGHWVFWLGPAIASMAFYLYTKAIIGQHDQDERHKYDFLTTLKLIFTTNK